MQLFLLSALTMAAFAANSVLNRLGVAAFGMDPVLFAVIRVAAGVAMLWLLVLAQGGRWPGGGWRHRISGAASLALYMAGFSLAYLTLDAGVGALILFGGVQITMFAGAALAGERITPLRLAGAAVALVGLVVLVWPSEAVVVPPQGIALMLAAAFGWGVYSLLGRSEDTPLAATAANFVICFPLLLPLLFWAGQGWSWPGVLAAIVAGAVTSGMGYALWYQLVPRLGATRAAVTQLSVPVIAAFGGAIVLSEPVGIRFAIAAALVIGGIAMSMLRR